MSVSNTQKQLPDTMEDYQFVGIAPDIAVWITEEDSVSGRDTILEEAINLALE